MICAVDGFDLGSLAFSGLFLCSSDKFLLFFVQAVQEDCFPIFVAY